MCRQVGLFLIQRVNFEFRNDRLGYVESIILY